MDWGHRDHSLSLVLSSDATTISNLFRPLDGSEHPYSDLTNSEEFLMIKCVETVGGYSTVVRLSVELRANIQSIIPESSNVIEQTINNANGTRQGG